MSSFPINKLNPVDFPPLLREIPQPPQTLNYRGSLPDPDLPLMAVVGSRHFTNYGQSVVEHLIGGLRGYNIGIVSGLALGIDSLAHQIALDTNLYTLAIPGGGLNDSVIYPARHKALARKILDSGGGLLSEYEPDFHATRWSFPQRNRLVCGIAAATLVIEAAPKSGSLITARMATDYNRELLVVPGSIFSLNSQGTHQFMKLGATPITEANDIVELLHLEKTETDQLASTADANLSADESSVLNILTQPTERDDLIRQLELPVQVASTLLMDMELQGLITSTENTYRRIQ